MKILTARPFDSPGVSYVDRRPRSSIAVDLVGPTVVTVVARTLAACSFALDCHPGHCRRHSFDFVVAAGSK